MPFSFVIIFWFQDKYYRRWWYWLTVEKIHCIYTFIRTIHVDRDFRNSLIQPLAECRISCQIRLGHSGLYPVLQNLQGWRVHIYINMYMCIYIYMFFFHLVLKLGDKSEWVNRIKEWLNLERTSGDRLFQPFYSSRATSSRLYRTMFRVFRSEIVTLRFWSRIDINA